MHQNRITDQQLRDASNLVARHLGMEVIVAAVHGSIMRGYSDPNSDVDVCFLVNRPVSDYINMTCSNYFENTQEERRRKTTELSAKMTRELGWNIMVSLLDMRSLLRGIMGGNTYSLMAYESFAARSDQVKFLFEGIVRDYFSIGNVLFRCGEHVTLSLRKYAALDPQGMEFKRERTYLSILWTLHRMLSYLGGDRQHVRTIQSMIEFNRNAWGDVMPEGFHSQVLGVIKARTERSHFDMPLGVSVVAVDLLKTFAANVLGETTLYLRSHPQRHPSVGEETREMIDLYSQLLDYEDQALDDAEKHDKEKRDHTTVIPAHC